MPDGNVNTEITGTSAFAASAKDRNKRHGASSGGANFDTIMECDYGSEVSYEGALANKNFGWTILKVLFSLQLLFCFTLSFLILYCLESYQYIFCKHSPCFHTRIHNLNHLLHVVVLMNIVHLIGRIWYRFTIKRTVFPSYYIHLRLVVETIAAILSVVFNETIPELHLAISCLRCYHIYIFYIRASTSDNKNNFVVLLQKYSLLYMFLIHTATCALAFTCLPCEEVVENARNKNHYMSLDVPRAVFKYDENNNEYVTAWKWYFVSMYYCIGAITFNGANSATNNAEALIMIALMILTAYVNLLFTCDLTLENYYYYHDDSHYRAQVAQFSKIMPELAQSIHSKVINYFINYYEKESAINLYEHLEIIPWGMQSELVLDVYWFALTQTQLFYGESKFFRRLVASIMHIVSYTSGEVIYETGSRLTKVHYVARGNVCILSDEDDEAKVVELGVGACFGDFNLVYGMKSRFTLIAYDYTCLYVLDKTSFWRLKNLRLLLKTNLQFKMNNRIALAKLKLDKKPLEKTLIKIKSYLPREKRVDIYDPRNSYKKNTFRFKYTSYVLSDARHSDTSDHIFFSTEFPWKLDPDNSFLKIWKLLILLTIALVTCIHPYYIFVLQDYSSIGFVIVNIYVNIIFLIDVLIKLVTIIESNKIITTMWTIFVTQCTRCMFYVDIVAAIPWMLFTLAPSKSIHWIPILHVIKAVQIPVYIRSIMMKNFFTKDIFIYLQLFQNVFYVLTTGYVCSCLLYFLVHIYLPASERTRSFLIGYKTMSQILQVNLGLSLNMFEIISSCVICFLGLYLLLQYVASFTSTVILEKQLNIAYKEKVKDANRFMRRKSIPRYLRDRVHEYLQCQWDWNKLTKSLELLAIAPEASAKSWNYVFFRELLEKLEIFRYCNEDVLKSIAGCCRTSVLPPREVLLYGGIRQDKICIIQEGYVEMVYPQNGIIHSILGPGTLVGIIETLLGKPIPFIVRAYTHVKLVTLKVDDVITALSLEKDNLKYLNIALQSIDPHSWIFTMTKYTDSNQRSSARNYRRSEDSFFRFTSKRTNPVHLEWKHQYEKSKYLEFLKSFLMPRTLLPDGRFLYNWEICRALVVWLFCIKDSFIYMFWKRGILIELGIGMIFYVFMLADMYIQMHVCYYNQRNILVLHPKATATHYLKSRFIIDFVGSFPMKLLFMISYRSSGLRKVSYQVYHTLGCNKYLLLIRARELWHDQRLFENQRNLKFGILFLVIACVLINISTNILLISTSDVLFLDDVIRNHATFKGSASNNSFDFYVLSLRKVSFDVFLVSCTNTDLSTIFNINEFNFNLYNTILGYFFLGILIAFFVSIYQAPRVNTYKEELNSLRHYMRFFKVSGKTKNLLLSHFYNTWTRSKTIDRKIDFPTCPQELFEDICIFLHNSTLRMVKHPLISPMFQRQLSPHLEEAFYNPGHIYEVNDVIDTLYILKSGQIEILSGSGSVLKSLPLGSIFGNFDNIGMVRSMYAARCSGVVILLKIKTTEFYRLITTEGLSTLLDRHCSSEGSAYILGAGSVMSFEHFRSIWDRDTWVDKRWSSIMIALYIILAIFSYCLNLLLMVDFLLPPEWFSKRDTSRVQMYLRISLVGMCYLCDLLTAFKVAILVGLRKRKKFNVKTFVRSVTRQRAVVFDLVSLIPLELIVFAFDYRNFSFHGGWIYHLYTWLHFNRLVRIYCLLEYYGYIRTKKPSNTNRIQKLSIFSNFYLSFFTGICLFYFALPEDQKHLSLACFHTISILTLRGQSFCPENIATFFLIFYIVTSRILFVVNFAAILDIMEQDRRYLLIFNTRLRTLCKAIVNAKVSRSFEGKILIHTEKAWLMCRGRLTPTILEACPRLIRNVLNMETFGKLVGENLVFRGCHPDFMKQMIGYVQVRNFFDTDVICHEGDMDGTMYFVYYGHVEVLVLDNVEVTIEHLFHWDSFGLVQGLFPTSRHDYTYRSKKVTLMCFLRLADWRHLMDFFPAAKFSIYENIKELIDAEVTDAGNVIDKDYFLRNI